MMNRFRYLVAAVLLVPLALLAAGPAAGQSDGTDVSVTGARTVFRASLSGSSTLAQDAARVTPRIVVNYPDFIKQRTLAAPPSELQSVARAPRPRIVLYYVDFAVTRELAYPQQLFIDTAPGR